ncbi:sigma-70 family RNA polymerase sigma factor [Paucibacter sp. APW11]|uniref:Sigma-70 family RNA polymerase sigma factor n=1 Tax=Roseateles aquae TaxID=3077235 RepID=A0ABU3PDR2_9BURK|nr:sigma-70 family RNA polymerase sigma factor [Paucibacter sp. APW11]MDT9000741.1 sigma-70 family RNA polymerase sigma factor [Paucibacter sp. APW11]
MKPDSSDHQQALTADVPGEALGRWQDEGEPEQPGWPAGLDEAEAAALELDPAETLPVPNEPDALPVAASESQLAAWIEALVDQDERAMAALYDATFSRLFGMVRRIVRKVELAEEVCEDAYFQAWRQAPRFDPARGSALAWLLAIARSRAIDALRREARFVHEELNDELSAERQDEAAGSDDLLDAARHHAALHRALLQLGAQPRQLVSLAFFRGLSHEEIALQTCLPLGTVKSQIRRALITLKQVLGGSPGLAF